MVQPLPSAVSAPRDMAGPIPPLAWSESLATGLPEIDGDHRHIIEKYGALAARAAAGHTSATVFRRLSRDLLEAMLHHFEREEEVLLLSRFPRYQTHVREHGRFVSRFMWLADRLVRADTPPGETADTVARLGELLIDLLLRCDLDYKSHLLHARGR